MAPDAATLVDEPSALLPELTLLEHTVLNPLKNFRALSKQVRREIARSYLYEQAPEHLREFPQMCCYSFDYLGIGLNVDGRCDREALEYLLALVAPRIKGRTIVDVGANIGNHSAAFAEVSGKVIAFEPHPTTFQLLKLNLSRFDNVLVLPIGASDHTGVVRALSPKLNYGATAITDRQAADNESEWTFPVAPIDDQQAIAGADVALMKFDVEGHEPSALRGSAQTIARNKPIIIFEQNLESIDDGTSESLEIVKSFGYTHFYALDVAMPWRSPQWLPGPVRKLARIAESLIFGPVEYCATFAPVDRLEVRHYPMLIASMEPLRPIGPS